MNIKEELKEIYEVLTDITRMSSKSTNHLKRVWDGTGLGCYSESPVKDPREIEEISERVTDLNKNIRRELSMNDRERGREDLENVIHLLTPYTVELNDKQKDELEITIRTLEHFRDSSILRVSLKLKRRSERLYLNRDVPEEFKNFANHVSDTIADSYLAMGYFPEHLIFEIMGDMVYYID